MNCELFNLGPIEVEQHQTKEVLRCLLHSIVFQRALGPVTPKEVDSELFDVTWVQCGDPGVERKVEEKVEAFAAWLQRNPGKRGGQVLLSFFERRAKPASWFGRQEERLYWEQWHIHISVADGSAGGGRGEQATEEGLAADSLRGAARARVQAALEDALLAVVRGVNERRDHIPPVTSASAVPFPFDISVEGEGGSVFGLDVVKRMLLASNPPSVLH